MTAVRPHLERLRRTGGFTATPEPLVGNQTAEKLRNNPLAIVCAIAKEIFFR
jgi:hypothetical protein